MIEADQTMLLLSLQREIAEMKKRSDEANKRNELEIQALHKENGDMKKKLREARSSIMSTNLVSKSYTSPPRANDETKDNAPTQEINGESCRCPKQSVCTTGIMDSMPRPPFTNAIIEVPLPDGGRA